MPSSLHEVLIELFRHCPALAVELLGRAFGLTLPAYRGVRVEPGDFTDVAPAQYQADAVVVLSGDAAPVLGVVVEVQLRRDEGNRWSWPVYVATLRARLRCPVALLVVCVDETTARWAARPLEMGPPGSRTVPLVLGPQRVPVITDASQAVQVPELAVLSAMAHGGGPDRVRVLDALVGALGTVDQDRFSLYSDVVLAALPEAARHHLEALVKIGTYEYEYQSEFVRRYIFQGRAEGRAEGEAKAVLAVLDARGIAVAEPERSRIITCTDLDQLDVWVRRAVTAESVQDLFR